MNRRTYLAVAGTVAAVSLGGCLGAARERVEELGEGGLSDDDFDIGMSANAFLPERYEVAVGETVIWGNNGSRGHTVTAYDEAIPEDVDFFASGGFEATEPARDAWHNTGAGNIPPGETFSHTFDTPGLHGYFCIPHEPAGMVGTIVVEE